MAEAIEHYVLGKVTTRLRDDGAEYDIRVRLESEDRPNVIAAVDALPIPASARRRGDARVGREGGAGGEPHLDLPANQARIVRVGAGIGDRPLDRSTATSEKAGRNRGPRRLRSRLGGEQTEQARRSPA